jgi:hypothetical protein
MAERQLLPVIIRKDLPEQGKLLVLVQENDAREVAPLWGESDTVTWATRQYIKVGVGPCPAMLGCRRCA